MPRRRWASSTCSVSSSPQPASRESAPPCVRSVLSRSTNPIELAVEPRAEARARDDGAAQLAAQRQPGERRVAARREARRVGDEDHFGAALVPEAVAQEQRFQVRPAVEHAVAAGARQRHVGAVAIDAPALRSAPRRPRRARRRRRRSPGRTRSSGSRRSCGSSPRRARRRRSAGGAPPRRRARARSRRAWRALAPTGRRSISPGSRSSWLMTALTEIETPGRSGADVRVHELRDLLAVAAAGTA